MLFLVEMWLECRCLLYVVRRVRAVVGDVLFFFFQAEDGIRDRDG